MSSQKYSRSLNSLIVGIGIICTMIGTSMYVTAAAKMDHDIKMHYLGEPVQRFSHPENVENVSTKPHIHSDSCTHNH